MSIKGAINVGGSLGKLGTGFVFNYTKDVYENKISELETSIARLNEHLDTLRDLKSQIPQFWEDDNARETAQALDKTIRKVEQQMSTAESLMQTLRTAVNSLDSSKEELHKSIEDALGLLNLLDL